MVENALSEIRKQAFDGSFVQSGEQLWQEFAVDPHVNPADPLSGSRGFYPLTHLEGSFQEDMEGKARGLTPVALRSGKRG
ncbi:MAG: hypothetical protein HC921_06155 [Synechococcaceae cyanobacterium SM2_3_1]|nr:hypothetical protein [Synechococcaceae cyanobacterium SM2_3_1]